MTEKETTTEPEDKEAPESTETDTQEPEAPAEPTVAELHEEEKTEEAPKKPDSVPLQKFIDEKRKRKELQKELDSLKTEYEDDPDVDDDEVDDRPDVKAIAEKIEKLEKFESSQLKAQRDAQKNATFEKNFASTLENVPEYTDVVNKEVIRQMAFNPANANKTYLQLIEEAYGNAISGRRTIETTTPRGGAKDTKVDLDRARTDGEYRREVLADPELRRQYNENLTDRIPL